ncbi:NAD(P)-binding domain-containing protein [Solwaraspora sp. WMMA2056]|uniref:NADPH-dependent F420 reductase n=1 Tax=Solwaraspora sp. WMMA2056 TaxID=3015161 RepID=UPI00259B4365|nr:NAD(P)-binding domain-containing protein [Solwaraspora sp. WMMA2056]WJK40158.1 NAD(P)-binding domain-containing protein [Solwaraspora sp. WMMA2056]
MGSSRPAVFGQAHGVPHRQGNRRRERLMDIGIIGAGNVGSALARRLTEVGHQVTISASSPDSPRLADATTGTGVTAGEPAQAAAAELVVLAVPYTGIADTLTGPVADALTGTTVIDVTNPLGPDHMSLRIGHDTSAAEQVAAMIPEANVVKAFNTVLAPNHARPVLGGVRQSVPVAGDDLVAKKTVQELGTQLGFDAVDAGPLTSARYLEPVAALLIQLAYGGGAGPTVGFAIARD